MISLVSSLALSLSLAIAPPGEPTAPAQVTPPVAKPEVAKPEVVKPEATKPEATKPEAAKPDPARARVEEFLEALEKSGATIESMSGSLSLEKYDALLEETERRFGRLVLDKAGGKRRFTIHFEEFIDGSGRADRAIDHWIYADGWLCEQDFRNKSFTKRQIVAPGETFDPLALGEGPIPIPIGQKKAEVLARFEVAETEIPLDIPLLGSMRNVAGLKLVPKAGTPMAKETAAIELFYDRTSLAPTGVVIREKSGNRSVARITKPVVNGEVSDDDRKLLVIPSPDPKEWTIDVCPWRKPE